MKGKISFDHLAMLSGVKEARMIETPYKLISREYARLAGESEQPRIKGGQCGRSRR